MSEMKRGDILWLKHNRTGEVFQGRVDHVMGAAKFTATRVGSYEAVTVGSWAYPMAVVAQAPR